MPSVAGVFCLVLFSSRIFFSFVFRLTLVVLCRFSMCCTFLDVSIRQSACLCVCLSVVLVVVAVILSTGVSVAWLTPFWFFKIRCVCSDVSTLGIILAKHAYKTFWETQEFCCLKSIWCKCSRLPSQRNLRNTSLHVLQATEMLLRVCFPRGRNVDNASLSALHLRG